LIDALSALSERVAFDLSSVKKDNGYSVPVYGLTMDLYLSHKTFYHFQGKDVLRPILLWA